MLLTRLEWELRALVKEALLTLETLLKEELALECARLEVADIPELMALFDAELRELKSLEVLDVELTTLAAELTRLLATLLVELRLLLRELQELLKVALAELDRLLASEEALDPEILELRELPELTKLDTEDITELSKLWLLDKELEELILLLTLLTVRLLEELNLLL